MRSISGSVRALKSTISSMAVQDSGRKWPRSSERQARFAAATSSPTTLLNRIDEIVLFKALTLPEIEAHRQRHADELRARRDRRSASRSRAAQVIAHRVRPGVRRSPAAPVHLPGVRPASAGAPGRRRPRRCVIEVRCVGGELVSPIPTEPPGRAGAEERRRRWKRPATPSRPR